MKLFKLIHGKSRTKTNRLYFSVVRFAQPRRKRGKKKKKREMGPVAQSFHFLLSFSANSFAGKAKKKKGRMFGCGVGESEMSFPFFPLFEHTHISLGIYSFFFLFAQNANYGNEKKEGKRKKQIQVASPFFSQLPARHSPIYVCKQKK